MRFGILGPLEISEGDVRLEPSARRLRRLLLALLTARGEQVGIDHLIDAVWPTGTSLPKAPTATLRTYVARLRGTLEPEGVGGAANLLVGGPDRYELRLDGHELDAAAFEADLSAAWAVVDQNPADALRRVERGLARWRGRALDEVADELWARPESARLEELRLSARELRVRCLLDTGRHAEVLGDLERQVAEHPLRETPHAQLMLTLHRCGRTIEATEVFRSYRSRLVGEAGLEPSPRIDRVHRHVLEGPRDDAGTGAREPLPASTPLPAPTTSLVGREAQVTAIDDRLSDTRVLTLTGVGGVGKTRLALELAHTRRASGRVLFVDLSRIRRPDAVIGAVADALRLTAEARGDRLEGLVRLLRGHPVLLVLDNCEHVRDEVAALVDRLVRGCSELRVLATSRETLGLEGEHVHRVPPLEHAAGVQLFLARAEAAGSAAPIGPTDLEHVDEICRRLDGIPLAIEFAAARTSHLTVAAIAERLHERFWLLTGGRHRAARHQTMQAVMDFSYQLLERDQQRVLRVTSVFAGDFDAPALAGVAGLDVPSAIDQLGALVASSLLETEPRGAETRYRLLETVRLHARGRADAAGELPGLQDGHARYFLHRALAEPARLAEPGRLTGYVADWDDQDLANYLAALDRLERDRELADVGRLATRMVAALGYRGFLDADGRYLGREDIATALSESDERALYLTVSAANANCLGQYEQQLALGDAALRDARDPATRLQAATLLANACTVFDPGRIPGLVDDTIRDVPPEAVPTRAWLRLRCHEPMGLVAQGRLDDAAEGFEALTGQGEGLAAAECGLVHWLRGRPQQALAVPRPGDLHADDAVWNYRWELVRALVTAAEGAPEQARRHLRAAAQQTRAVPARLLDHDVLLGCAAAAYHAGDPRRAAELLATFRGMVRTPAAFALYLHYRRLLKPLLSGPQRNAILERAADLDPGLVLQGVLGVSSAGPTDRASGPRS